MPTNKKRREKASPGRKRARLAAVAGEITTVLQRLKTEIKTRGFTQDRVARELGWTPSTLSGLLLGKHAVHLEHVLLICSVIESPPEELFSSRDPTAEQQLQRLLETRGNPAQVLGGVDEAALMSAARGLLEAAGKRLEERTASERAYLKKVVRWCECSIVLDKRAEQRRAEIARKGVATHLHEPRLKWPDFKEGTKGDDE